MFKPAFIYCDITIETNGDRTTLTSYYAMGQKMNHRVTVPTSNANIVNAFVNIVEANNIPAIIQLHFNNSCIRSILYAECDTPEKEKIVLALNRTNSKIAQWNNYRGVCGTLIDKEGFDIHERTEDGKIVCCNGKPVVKFHVPASKCASWKFDGEATSCLRHHKLK